MRILLVFLTLALPLLAQAQASAKPDLVLPDGGTYFGPLRNNRPQGQGRVEWKGGAQYEGGFENGQFEGEGRLRGPDGRRYVGSFARGKFQGKGRAEMPSREIFESDFSDGEFTGSGTYSNPNGARYRGEFLKWSMHGEGRFTDSNGDIYEGTFSNGALNGKGRAINKNGAKYEGEFKAGLFEGQGTMRMPNGDEYRGGFARGVFDGQGTLRYAAPKADGSTQASGVWKQGKLDAQAELAQAALNVERALFQQRPLLDQALASLAPSQAGRINLYLLAIAGDGSQEVFRREAEFVRGKFDSDYGTRSRSVALVNSRSTVESAPMATLTSIRETLRAIAAKMNKDNDILFVFLTSHGSNDHEFRLAQNAMLLRGMRPADLAGLLKETGARWKAVVVSACYSGAFIDALKDDQTLVIAASRADRQSFGCADANDFTYFGRAFFKEALGPGTKSFDEAFKRAQALVNEWELRDKKAGSETSQPQIHSPKPVADHLRRWWAQPRGR